MNKKNIAIIGIVGILVILWISRRPGEKNEERGIEPTPTLYQRQNVFEKIDYPEEIEWSLDRFEAENEMIRYKAENKPISNEETQKFLGFWGLDYQDKTQETGSIIFFKKDNRGAYVNIPEGIFSYTKTINNKNDLRSETKKSIDELERIIRERIAVLGIENGDFGISGFEYKKFIYPYWQSSNENEAEAVEFEGGWMVKGVMIENDKGNMVRVTIKRDGEIIKMEINRPFLNLKEGEVIALKNWNEVRGEKVEKFKINKIWGNVVYETNPEELVKKAVIKKMKTIYVLENGGLEPYFKFEGETRLKSGPSKFIIILKATKDE